MNQFFVQCLLFFSALVGVKSTPADLSSWKIEQNWHRVGDAYVFSASSDSLWKDCEGKPKGFIEFPQVVHGVHKIFVNQKLVGSFGDETFQTASPFYNRGSISCEKIESHSTVRWEVASYSQYFSRFDYFPRYASAVSAKYFLDVIINIISFGGLLVLSAFSLFIFRGKVAIGSYLPLSLGAASWAIYSAMTVSNVLGFELSMLAAHKIADIFLWIGTCSYFYFYKTYGYLRNFEIGLFFTAVAFAETIIIFGTTGDAVQFGTTIPFVIIPLCVGSIVIHAALDIRKKGLTKYSILGFVSTLGFAIAGTNDVVNILGIVSGGYMILPIAAVSGVFFLAAAVNQEIEKTYDERNSLLNELEQKVDEKTKHLTEAMDSLKRSQAELVQSARLASLGTLSAGIAHEINNSINYVNGALLPLEKRVMKSIPDADRALVEKLFAAIKEGTSLTVEIVRSLRNFTGMNQAKVKEVRIEEISNSILAILRNKLKEVKVDVEIEPQLSLMGHQVGLNQIFMNILTNALDAVDPNDGKIFVKAFSKNNEVIFEFSDNGTGMPVEVANRIFDPFYTTKDVGKGTGLGLHIVKKEVDRHGGKIEVLTAPQQGTTFRITIPRMTEAHFQQGEAA